MKKLIMVLSVLSLAACAKIDRALEIPDKMDRLGNNTEELKRLTIIAEMKKELEDEKNYRIVSPVPYDLNAAAKKAAENFKVDEVVPWTYNLLSKVNNAKFEENFGKPVEGNEAEALQFERNKIGTMSALAAVSAFLPEATINEMITLVRTSEEYTPTVLAIFAMRAYFINNVLMKEKYGSAKLTEIGTVEKAIYYNQQVEKLLRLEFAPSIKIQITGFSLMEGVNEAMSYGLDQEAPARNWKAISYGLEHYLKVSQYSNDKGQKDSQLDRQSRALQLVNAGLAEWVKTTP